MAEGNSWLTNYDIFVAAGEKNRAVVASNTVKITDGMLDLTFTSKSDRASVYAVEVVPENSEARLAWENQFV